jgi:hypothetical protein
MLRGNHYRAHDSSPTTEYLLDMNKHLGGKPAAVIAKPNASVAQGRAALAKSDAVFAKATAALERLESFMAPLMPKTDEAPLAKFETTNPILAAALAKIDNLAKKLDDTLSAWEQSRRSPREASRDIEGPSAPVRIET